MFIEFTSVFSALQRDLPAKHKQLGGWMKPRSSKDMGKTRVLPGPGDYSQAPCQLGGEVRIFTSQLIFFFKANHESGTPFVLGVLNVS